jgi:hypothetical protein
MISAFTVLMVNPKLELDFANDTLEVIPCASIYGTTIGN